MTNPPPPRNVKVADPHALDPLMADLTPAQRQAVAHLEGPMLVLAGAGSGKTRVITRRIAYLIRSGAVGSSILAITFTNKAAGEMKRRIEDIVPNSGVWVGTFHSVCARLMRTYAPLIGLDRGFTIHDSSDRIKVIKACVRQLGLDDAGVSAERLEAVISKAKNDLVAPETLARNAWNHEAVLAARVYPLYQQRLREQSAVDFDDLLLHMVAILKNHPEVRKTLDARFRFLLVDEYQDTNLAQYAILKALSVDHPNLCVTGDPDQSIYAWRGANIHNILEFEKDFPGCKVVKLERNYRSTRNILTTADGLIRHNRLRKPKALLTENPPGAPVRVVTHANEAAEARAVAAAIRDRVDHHGFSYSDIAIFCRVTALTRNLESALRSARIPYQVVGGVAFYERQEVKDLLAYLKLAVNPKDDVAFERVVNTPPRGLGQTTLDHLRAYASRVGIPLLRAAREAQQVAAIKDKAARSLRDFALLMDELATLRDQPAEAALRSVLALTSYRAYLAEAPQGEAEERLANLDELVSAAREYDATHTEPTLDGFLEEVSLISAVDRMRDDAGAVAVMTLHAAKGLEFPVVFIIGLEEGILPHSRSSESREELEEERRLLFVGITRAQKELTISHCKIREYRGQRQVMIPSCFLNELPEESVEYEDRSAREPSGFHWVEGNHRAFQSSGRNGASWGLAPREPNHPAGRPRTMRSPTHDDDAIDPPAGDDLPEVPIGRPAASSGSSSSQSTGFRMITAADLAGAHPTHSSQDEPGQSPDPIQKLGPQDVERLKPGTAVLHPHYGLGRVTGIDGAGPQRKGRIRFAAGEKTFVLAKTPLRIISKPDGLSHLQGT